ncbi:MAG: hypothetical protein JWM10_4390, partial [Myxococcaceae bacterium]|nr:hypothetical protein [Myxococcaceae bacterium]
MRLAVGMAALLAGGAAQACPCGAALGPVAPWTLPAEGVAVAAGLSGQTELGSVDGQGRAWSAPRGVSTQRVFVDLAAAWRVVPSVELAAQWSAAWADVTLPGAASRGVIAGDLGLRARWEAAA